MSGGQISSAGSGSGSTWSHVGGGQDGRFFNDGDDLEPLQIAKRTATEFWTAFESGDGERLRELVAVAKELDVATWQLYAFGRDIQGASEMRLSVHDFALCIMRHSRGWCDLGQQGG